MHPAALLLSPTKTADTINTEKIRMARRRVVAVVRPKRSNAVNTTPPATLPRAAVRKGIQAVSPIRFIVNPWTTFKYCGTQKIYKYQAGSLKTLDSVNCQR